MWTRRSLVRFLCCFLAVESYVGTSIIHAESKSMARPTRFENIGETARLKEFLESITNQSSQKARYGKRDDINPTFESNATWEILKMIAADVQRQNQLRRQQKTRQKEEQILFRDSQNSDGIKHMSNIATRPGYLLDVIDKYYDDVQ